MSRQYIPALSGLRVIAATMVFLSHLWIIFPYKIPWLLEVFQQFHTGVTFFFVLSGFLMGYLYYGSLTTKKRDIVPFYIKRFIRIYPIYLIVTLIVLLQEHFNGLTWFINIFALKGFFLAHVFAGIAPAWTVTVDITFYMLVPWIFRYWKKVNWWWQVGIWYLVGLGLFGIGSLVSWHTFCGSMEFMLFSTFFGRAFEFLSGSALGIYIAKTCHPKRHHSFPLRTMAGLIIISIGVYILVLLKRSDYQNLGLLNPWGIVTNNYMVAAGVLCLIWGLCSEKSWLKTGLSHPWLVVLGNCSYIFFLIHYTVIGLGLYTFLDRNFWLLYGGLWLLSYLAYTYIDQPIARFLSKKLLSDRIN